MTDILTALKQVLGRLATGDPTASVVTQVDVQCHKCGGVTVFPVLKDGGVRRCPAPCRHCGTDI
jgi:hypothetical protein